MGGKILLEERLILDGELKEGYYIEPTIIEGLPSDCLLIRKKFLVQLFLLFLLKLKRRLLQWQTLQNTDCLHLFLQKNISKGHRVAASIDSGVIWINTWLLKRFKDSIWRDEIFWTWKRRRV